MKTFKYLFLLLISLLLVTSCSEEIMDEINEEKNDALEMSANNMLPDVLVKSGFETAGTDIAWYTSVYIEHNAGTWNQMYTADVRQAQNDNSLMNNSWNSLYDVMNVCNTIIERTDPETGEESGNTWARGIAETMMAYNLGVTTDMWGSVPYSEAFEGSDNLEPKYDDASAIYSEIFSLLDAAVADLAQPSLLKDGSKDLIFSGEESLWTSFAYALKARHYLRLVNVDDQAAAKALVAVDSALYGPAMFQTVEVGGYEWAFGALNPWWEFWYFREQHAFSQTLYDLMVNRNDPRLSTYAYPMGDDGIVPAPNGTAIQSQGTVYSEPIAPDRLGPIPLMTYHELKFIEAEAKFRTSDPTWETALQEAVTANFLSHGLTADTANYYFTNIVQPNLTAGNELNEILTQKFIGAYLYESIEAYNDYRRTGIPTMNNPKNATVGFVNVFPWALSEVSSNGKSIPNKDRNVYEDKVYWAK
jgi:hypothetical protein